MQRIMIWVAAVGILGVTGFGCSRSLERAKANYHEDRAERAAEHGHFRKAAREERKAERARDAEAEAPLP